MTPKIQIEINNYKIKNREKFLVWINRVIKVKNGKYEFIFRKQRKQRSTQQNNYLWGVCYKIISDITGESIDAIHEYCKLNFGIKEKVNGIWRGRSTTEFSTIEMMEYVDKIRKWVFDFFEVDIPLPDTVEV